MSDKKYKAKGFMTFYVDETGIKNTIIEKEQILKPFNGEDFLNQFEKDIYDLFSGHEFYSFVDSGYIIDYDGSLATIYVDGYSSNLGLHHHGFSQGKVLVSGKLFLKLCEKYKIEVNWAGK